VRAQSDDLQVQLQRVQAQKAALEERSAGEDAARQELQKLKVEKLQMESELECAKMREDGMANKMRDSMSGGAELQKERQRAALLETELEASRAQVGRLGEQLSKVTQDGSASRSDSLDQLRSELLSRIDGQSPASKKSNIAEAAPEPEERAEPEGRKTLMNQRALFDSIRKQFAEASGPVVAEEVEEMAQGTEASIVELEEELKSSRRENVELSVKLAKLEDEVRQQGSEASQLLKRSGQSAAEAEDTRMQLDREAAAARRWSSENAELQAQVSVMEGEMASMKKRLLASEETRVRKEEEARAAVQKAHYSEEERGALESRVREVQAQAADAQRRERAAAAQVEEQQQLAEQSRQELMNSERQRIESESQARWVDSENQRIKVELNDANSERLKIKQVVEELMTSHGEGNSAQLQEQVAKFKKRAEYFEREYNQSKQLNQEMTKVMTQMTQAVSERSDQNSESAGQIRLLKGQLEAKVQDLKLAKSDRDEIQRQLDKLKSTDSYYQDKYREATDELKTLRHEHSIATATSTKMRQRVESMQRECDDLRSHAGRQAGVDSPGGDDGQIRELQGELERSKAFAKKSQAVNDCLNTLLVLESEQTSLFETACPITDQALVDQFQTKKSKAQNVISRLNDIMTEEERPSIAFLQRR